MSSDRGASCSDVERARVLSKRLEAHARPPAPKTPRAPEPSSGAGYIRFDAARFVPAEPARPLRPAAPAAPALGDWDALLGWVRQLAGADVVVLGDGRGLLVAFSGNIDHERAEAMGARLVLAFEHADRMEANAEPSRLLTIDFGGLVVSGLRIALPEGGRLVLGIAGPLPIEPATRVAIERALAERARV